MPSISNPRSISNFHRISDNPLVHPLISYHGKFVSAFTEELPPSGKVGEVIKRIVTVVVAPLAYLALGALALVGATMYGIGCLRKKGSQSQHQITMGEKSSWIFHNPFTFSLLCTTIETSF